MSGLAARSLAALILKLNIITKVSYKRYGRIGLNILLVPYLYKYWVLTLKIMINNNVMLFIAILP